MKDKMEIAKFKSAPLPDILARVVEVRRDLMNRRFALSMGNLNDTASVRAARKAVARLKTYARAAARNPAKESE
ncbi:MAG: 50S ribosomal protein L29 [Rickettsiales bacterium]|jgi:ribosomal protein L29|nr:50S ribosomal protein L29 [Rickettsiales bacterium]